MSKSMEDLILDELRKHHPNTTEARIDYLIELCERLGLEKEGLNEITVSIEKLLREHSPSKKIH